MIASWMQVCKTNDIPPYSGVSAFVLDRRVAIFHIKGEYYAISDYDPFSGAYGLSRGIVDDQDGMVKVTSPACKRSFSLLTGEYLGGLAIRLASYPVQAIDDVVYIAIQAERESRHIFQTLSSQLLVG